MTRATSGVLKGPSGWLRTRAPGETFYLDHRDCFWSLASSLGPDGQPMIAVDLFFDTLDLEEQFARKDAIPNFFAAGAVYLSGLNSKGIVESGELEPISSSTVQRTPEITVFRASDGAFEDSQCGVGAVSGSPSTPTPTTRPRHTRSISPLRDGLGVSER